MARLAAAQDPLTSHGAQERRPIYVHQDLDDLPLTVEAFRVYMHLSRRSGKRNIAWPSYSSIGEHCFRDTYPNVQSASLRRKAIKAVAELEKVGIIKVMRRKVIGAGKQANRSNAYRILPRAEWKPELLERIEAKRQAPDVDPNEMLNVDFATLDEL